MGYGAMPLSRRGRPEESEAVDVIHAALDAGVDLIDTADVYCFDEHDLGHNERVIAKALARWPGPRPRVATKAGCTRPGGAWGHNGRPEHIQAACEASLKALGVDCIDLYQLHAPDEQVPFSDTMGAFVDLQAAGKIQHVGLSNVSRSQLLAALDWVEVVSVQNLANPYRRGFLTDGVLEECEARGVAFLPYSPVGGWQAHRTAHVPVLQTLAREHDATPFQVILAWLLALSPVMIPIPGASKAQNIRSSVASVSLSLSDAEMTTLNEAFSHLEP